MSEDQKKPIEWMGSSRDDLREFPKEVRYNLSFAILMAEEGLRHQDAKTLTGLPEFKGGAVVELVDDYDGNTYRATYTTKLGDTVYVLHCFQKKSKKGNETPKHDIDVIKKRLAMAKAHYEENYFGKKKAG